MPYREGLLLFAQVLYVANLKAHTLWPQTPKKMM